MLNRSWVIGGLQIALPYALSAFIPIFFLVRTSQPDQALRQIADGSLVAASMILCFSTIADLTAPYEENLVPQDVRRFCRALLVSAFMGGIILLLSTAMYPEAELNNGCFPANVERTMCSPLYPYAPSWLAIGQTLLTWFFMYFAYERTRVTRSQVMGRKL